MNEINVNDKSDLVLKAIETLKDGFVAQDDGVDLLSIVKKISRNRKKGQSPE